MSLVASSEGTNELMTQIRPRRNRIRRQVKLLAEKQKAEYERRDKEQGQEGAEGSGKKRGGQGGRRGKDNQQERPARGRDKKQEDDDHDEDDESGDQEFQKATEAMCVDGGASLHTSQCQLKQWAHEITAVEPSLDAWKPLKWSSTPIIFDTEDHPDRTIRVGCLSLLVSPTTRNL